MKRFPLYTILFLLAIVAIGGCSDSKQTSAKTKTISGTYYGTTTGDFQNQMDVDSSSISYDYQNDKWQMVMNVDYKIEGKTINFYYANKEDTYNGKTLKPGDKIGKGEFISEDEFKITENKYKFFLTNYTRKKNAFAIKADKAEKEAEANEKELQDYLDKNVSIDKENKQNKWTKDQFGGLVQSVNGTTGTLLSDVLKSQPSKPNSSYTDGKEIQLNYGESGEGTSVTLHFAKQSDGEFHLILKFWQD